MEEGEGGAIGRLEATCWVGAVVCPANLPPQEEADGNCGVASKPGG